MLKERSECVKVVMRCRPLSEDEIKNGNTNVVSVDSSKGGVTVSNPSNPKEIKPFFFDNSYDYRYIY